MYKEMLKQMGKTSGLLTLVFIIIWLLRMAADGELITGTIMCGMFGISIIYGVMALNALFIKKSYLLAICSGFLSIWFLYLWSTIIQILQDHLMNGTPFLIASENPVGLFGLTGFMGFFIVIPTMQFIMLLMFACVIIAEALFD